ncbi:VOC family protein [Salinibacterium sp. G-O1]|uniref:VOC family protein n=1 Tax=Salinibacterium sp. G-O1 TaxID=3046208 RepID=UPI0024BBB986|nr:VOC family protein [Salinibacterium sp. G-O1]MDJ0335618.1 VOC family protein [Salinibacterium sp. G-O1]
MTTKLNPYLGFRDDARTAMDFYQTVFGGDVDYTTFADLNASDDPSESTKIMHAQLTTPGGMTLMASDTPNSMEFKPGARISVSVTGQDEAELRGYWEKLSSGGTVVMPFEMAPWGDLFGMCTDQFGIEWMVSVTQ